MATRKLLGKVMLNRLVAGRYKENLIFKTECYKKKDENDIQNEGCAKLMDCTCVFKQLLVHLYTLAS